MNLTELLDRTASRWPEKPALIEGDIIVSYAGLVERATALASQLHSLAVRPGCRVGLCYPNSIAYVALTFALWRLNAVVVPLPMECTEEELSTIASTMRLEAILSQKPQEHSVPLSPECFFTRLTPTASPDNHGLNIAFIRFTSGTTSARKGVVLCHETIRDRINAANKALRIGPEDTVMWCLPMAHHFLVTIVLYLSEGATIVLARHVLARPFLDAVNRWRGTVLYASPFQYGLLARDTSASGLSSVRLAVSTTCRLPEDVAGSFQKRFGLPLTQALGVIELGLVCVNSDEAGRRVGAPGLPADAVPADVGRVPSPGALGTSPPENCSPAMRWDSVGRPLPDYAVRILNPDSEGYGEVAVAGPGFFDAYDNPWTWRDELMPDGWFATGDIGRLDEQGYLFLAGRKAAVINLAGRKVFPEEIEAVLNRHPAVRESRVYGRAHAHLGEVVEAEAVVKAVVEPEVLRDFCRAHLSADKVPSRINLVQTVAKTAVTGKIRRPIAPRVA